jgi:hypothetical protein
MHRSIVLMCILTALAVMPGCRGNGGPEPIAGPVSTVEEQEERLRQLVLTSVDRERNDQGEGSARLLEVKPFFYKEYWVLPEEEPVYSADFTEKESLSIPLTAEVELEKTRFSTRAKRDRAEVRSDNNYLRSPGIEQESYELRHGEWRRVGSLFIAQGLEEEKDGQWVQVEEQREVITIDEETPTGFWRKLMFWR